MLSSSQCFIIVVTFIWIKSSHASNSHSKPNSRDNQTALLELMPITIADVSPKTMDFTVDFQVVISWTNPNFNKSLLMSENTQGLSKIKKRDFDETDPPEFRFSNCKECSGILMDNSEMYYNHKSNRFIVMPRFAYKFICKFHMLSYPFDTQICNLTIVFVKDGRHILFDLLKYPLGKINTPPDYYLLNISKFLFTINHILEVDCVSYNFHLKHMLQRDISIIYLPSLIIVVISWISFWLDVSASGPRVSLGLTSLLTLITHFNNAQKNLPSVSILMALDVWMIVCIVTVFASMIEYAIVYNKWHKLKEGVKSTTEIKTIPNLEGKCLTVLKNIFSRTSKPTFLDELCQIVFPLFFTLFIFFYCIYYLLC